MSSELTGYPVSSLGIDMFSELTGLIDSLGVTYTLARVDLPIDSGYLAGYLATIIIW